MDAYAVRVKNITLALDDETLDAGRAYAQRHQTTLNALVRELLVKTACTGGSGLVSSPTIW